MVRTLEMVRPGAAVNTGETGMSAAQEERRQNSKSLTRRRIQDIPEGGTRITRNSGVLCSNGDLDSSLSNSAPDRGSAGEKNQLTPPLDPSPPPQPTSNSIVILPTSSLPPLNHAPPTTLSSDPSFTPTPTTSVMPPALKGPHQLNGQNTKVSFGSVELTKSLSEGSEGNSKRTDSGGEGNGQLPKQRILLLTNSNRRHNGNTNTHGDSPSSSSATTGGTGVTFSFAALPSTSNNGGKSTPTPPSLVSVSSGGPVVGGSVSSNGSLAAPSVAVVNSYLSPIHSSAVHPPAKRAKIANNSQALSSSPGGTRAVLLLNSAISNSSATSTATSVTDSNGVGSVVVGSPIRNFSASALSFVPSTTSSPTGGAGGGGVMGAKHHIIKQNGHLRTYATAAGVRRLPVVVDGPPETSTATSYTNSSRGANRNPLPAQQHTYANRQHQQQQHTYAQAQATYRKGNGRNIVRNHRTNATIISNNHQIFWSAPQLAQYGQGNYSQQPTSVPYVPAVQRMTTASTNPSLPPLPPLIPGGIPSTSSTEPIPSTSASVTVSGSVNFQTPANFQKSSTNVRLGSGVVMEGPTGPSLVSAPRNKTQRGRPGRKLVNSSGGCVAGGGDSFQPYSHTLQPPLTYQSASEKLPHSPNGRRSGITVRVSDQQGVMSSPNAGRSPLGNGIKEEKPIPDHSQQTTLPYLRSALSSETPLPGSARKRERESQSLSESRDAILDVVDSPTHGSFPALHQSGSTLGSAVGTSSVDIRQRRLERRAKSVEGRLQKLLLLEQTQYHVTDQLESIVRQCDSCVNDPTVAASTLETLSPTQQMKLWNRKSTTAVSSAGKDLLLDKKLDLIFRNGELKNSLIRKEDLLEKSAPEIGKLLKRYDAKRFGSLVSPNAATSVLAGKNQLALTSEQLEDVVSTSNKMLTHVQDLQQDYDSEATDLSSGGESCDEWDEEPRIRTKTKRKGNISDLPTRKPIPLSQRGAWEWLGERAWLGSRWGWLQSHMADLEYKIRQHVDICRQIRARKSPVTISREAAESKMNEFVSVDSDVTPMCVNNPEETCARVCPITMRTKRKLVPTIGSFKWNRKASRLPTVQCGCFPPLPPCILCSGRLKNVQAHPDVCSQSLYERVSILDHSFSPVLSSRKKGLALDRKLQAYLKQQATTTRIGSKRSGTSSSPQKGTTPTQNKQASPSSKSPGKRIPAESVLPTTEGPSPKKKVPGLRIKLSASVDKNDGSRQLTPKSSKSSSKNKNKVSEVKSAPISRPNSPSQQFKSKLAKKLSKKCRESRSRSHSRPQTPLSPAISVKTGDGWGSSGPSSPAKPGKLHGRRATAATHQMYDIDNIVIDPSVVAACRVEKLQYKEIAVPKWREVHIAPTKEPVVDVTEVEHMSDETFVSRHLTNEMEERKRFQVYKQAIWGPAQFSRRSAGADLATTNTNNPFSILISPRDTTTPPPPGPFSSTPTPSSTIDRTLELVLGQFSRSLSGAALSSSAPGLLTATTEIDSGSSSLVSAPSPASGGESAGIQQSAPEATSSVSEIHIQDSTQETGKTDTPPPICSVFVAEKEEEKMETEPSPSLTPPPPPPPTSTSAPTSTPPPPTSTPPPTHSSTPSTFNEQPQEDGRVEEPPAQNNTDWMDTDESRIFNFNPPTQKEELGQPEEEEEGT